MTEAEAVTQEAQQQKESPIEFLKRAVALRVKLTRVGTRRAVDTEKLGTGDADKDLLRVTKELFDSSEVRQIANHDAETRAAIRQRALPSLLGSGWYLIPVESVVAVDGYIEARKIDRAELVEKLVAALPEIKDRSKARLGHLWIESQFPVESIVRDRTQVSTKYRTFDTPASLRGISKAILERETQKAQAEAATARDAAIALLRAEMKEAVEAIANAFVPTATGRRRGLRPETLANVTAALDQFGARNIARDTDLAAFVDNAKKLLAGRESKDLSSDASVGEAFASIKDNISKLVEEGPARVLDFEE